jgi:hypothetical protein
MAFGKAQLAKEAFDVGGMVHAIDYFFAVFREKQRMVFGGMVDGTDVDLHGGDFWIVGRVPARLYGRYLSG